MSNTICTFATADDMIEAMFGPRQHDSHVKERNAHVKHVAWKAEYAANLARFEAHKAACGGDVMQALRTFQ